MKGSLQIGQSEYGVCFLTSNHETELQTLCERCSDFLELVEGKPPEKDAARDILTSLPPNKELKDKYVFGVHNEKSILVAVIDLIQDYKVLGEWTLGLLMIDPKEQGNGLGRKIHEWIIEWISKKGGKNLQIGVVEENFSGYAFWQKMGYVEVDRVTRVYGGKEHTVIRMNYLMSI